MQKILSSILALLLLVGCSAPTEKVEPTSTPEETVEATTETVVEPFVTDLKILVPTGAPALSLLKIMQNNVEQITTVDGSDLLQAAFVNPNPEYDVIIAPSNLGAKLASAGKTGYKMLGVVTWGNLYLVGTSEEALDGTGELALFGESAVPGLVFENLYADTAMNKTYYNSVADAQAALLSGNAEVALLAEPAATATIAKAKDSDLSLSILEDVQQKWEETNGSTGYPQAALFVQEEAYNADPTKYEALVDQIKADSDEYANSQDTIEADVDAVGADVLGIPSGAIVSKVWPRMNIRYVKASESLDALNGFLSLFGIADASSAIIQ